MTINKPILNTMNPSHIIRSCGYNLIILESIELLYSYDFELNSEIDFVIERELSGFILTESLFEVLQLKQSDQIIGTFLNKRLAFDSYFKISANYKTDKKFKFDYWINYKWFSQ